MNKPSEPFKTHFFLCQRPRTCSLSPRVSPPFEVYSLFFIRNLQVGCLFASSVLESVTALYFNWVLKEIPGGKLAL